MKNGRGFGTKVVKLSRLVVDVLRQRALEALQVVGAPRCRVAGVMEHVKSVLLSGSGGRMGTRSGGNQCSAHPGDNGPSGKGRLGIIENGVCACVLVCECLPLR